VGHCFCHLSKTDRYKIEALLNRHHSPREIAEDLHVHKSTVYREIRRARMMQRNTDWTEEERYNPDKAHQIYREHLAAKGAPLKIGNDFNFATYVENKIIDEDRSPATALADIKIEGKQFSTSICVTTFYSYIAKGVFLHLTNADLPVKPNRKNTYRKVRVVKRPPRGESIENRPKEVETREEFGHWEMDTVYSSKKKGSTKVLLVLLERKSRTPIIELMPNRTKESTAEKLAQLERRYGKLFGKIFKSFTVDNGSEFTDVELMERSVLNEEKRTKFYYCHPYSSYERGSNENLNKMIRRRYPKGTDFKDVSDAEIKDLENWLRNYPRKILGWKTSEMVFKNCLADLI
jgi:IS30 family transposase